MKWANIISKALPLLLTAGRLYKLTLQDRIVSLTRESVVGQSCTTAIPFFLGLVNGLR